MKTGTFTLATLPPPGTMTIQFDPNPAVETGTGNVVAVIQVEASSLFAADQVKIDSSQLAASCRGQSGSSVQFLNLQAGDTPANPGVSASSDIQATLDDFGNATVVVLGTDCTPGTSVIEATLTSAPHDTAFGILNVLAPAVTPPGVYGYPTTSGTLTTGEVETGDTPASGSSDAYGVFDVEFGQVDAGLPADISSGQLQNRCATWSWSAYGGTTGLNTVSGSAGSFASPVQGTLDADGKPHSSSWEHRACLEHHSPSPTRRAATTLLTKGTSPSSRPR